MADIITRYHKRRAIARVDVTPMVDLALLLVIFFMTTRMMHNQRVMEVQTPIIEEGCYLGRLKCTTPAYLIVRADGSMHLYRGMFYMGNIPEKEVFFDNAKLVACLKKWVSEAGYFINKRTQTSMPILEIFVKPEEDAPYEKVIEAIEAVQKSGIVKYALWEPTIAEIDFVRGNISF